MTTVQGRHFMYIEAGPGYEVVLIITKKGVNKWENIYIYETNLNNQIQ